MRRLLSITLLLIAGTAIASQVIAVGRTRKHIAISHEKLFKWRIDDRVCVVQDGTAVVCGSVIRATRRGAIVTLDTAYTGVTAGDQIIRQNGKRLPASQILDAYDEQGRFTPRRWDFGAGLGLGANYYYPDLSFQYAVSPHIAIGLVPLFLATSDTGTNVSAFGAYGTVNYYGTTWYQGFWARAGLGLLSFNASTTTGGSQSASVPAGLATVGWRFRLDSSTPLNLGLSGGLQYISPPNFTVIGTINSASVQALLSVDLSFNF